MKTLRLLVWLRWKLFLRSTSTSSRIAGIVFPLLLLLAFSPAWFGGAVAAYEGVLRAGAPVIAVAFGVCQLAWISMGILSGALGRSFDLDKFLRYPVRPRSVFAINVLASLLGPVPLMILPTMAAVTIAAGERAGLWAALGVGAAAVLLVLVTAAALQVLLAVFDEVLRRESARFVARILMMVCFVGLQFGGISVVEDAIHVTADGRRLWVVHGDLFDGVMQHARWLAHLGDKAFGSWNVCA